jgi:hypothetical protein
MVAVERLDKEIRAVQLHHQLELLVRQAVVVELQRQEQEAAGRVEMDQHFLQLH